MADRCSVPLCGRVDGTIVHQAAVRRWLAPHARVSKLELIMNAVARFLAVVIKVGPCAACVDDTDRIVKLNGMALGRCDCGGWRRTHVARSLFWWRLKSWCFRSCAAGCWMRQRSRPSVAAGPIA